MPTDVVLLFTDATILRWFPLLRYTWAFRGEQDQVKAYCTCEAVLLDVRTGLIPLTTVTTRDRMEKKEKQDLDVNETMRRAETAAVLDALDAVSDKLADFLANASDR